MTRGADDWLYLDRTLAQDSHRLGTTVQVLGLAGVN